MFKRDVLIGGVLRLCIPVLVLLLSGEASADVDPISLVSTEVSVRCSPPHSPSSLIDGPLDSDDCMEKWRWGRNNHEE